MNDPSFWFGFAVGVGGTIAVFALAFYSTRGK